MGYGADRFQRVHAARESEVCGALQINMSDLCGREEVRGIGTEGEKCQWLISG